MRAVVELRDRAGLSNQDLIDESGMSTTYYYARLKGELPFNSNDIERLALALGTQPFEVARLANALDRIDGASVEHFTLVEPSELARRLRLIESAPRPGGAPFDPEGLVTQLKERGVDWDLDQWSELASGGGGGRVPTVVLEEIAQRAGVPAKYLWDLEDASVADATEAQLEFRAALRDTGAEKISMRAVGEVSPDALRAITAALRSIPPS